MFSLLRSTRCIGVMLIGLSTLPSASDAQSWSVAAGPSVPQGPMGERRAVGGQVALSFGSEHRRRGFRYRVELTRGWFPIRSDYAKRLPPPGEGTLTMGSGMAYLLYGGAPGPLVLHGGVGAGAYEIQIPNRRNPYGLVGGIGVLMGATLGSGRLRGLVEIQQQVVLSDYGNGDYSAGTFAPFRVGIVVQ